uniref:Uncharacterized protein n=1 Tax=Nothobranchius furzeri TaxID=105023 RepID=A0A1A8B3F2_NOTFU
MEQHLTLTGTQHHAEGVGVCVSDDPCEKVCEGLTEDVTKEELYTKDSWEGMILEIQSSTGSKCARAVCRDTQVQLATCSREIWSEEVWNKPLEAKFNPTQR